MVNPMDFLKLKKMWEDFRDGHPRMMPFARAIAAGYIKEGTVFDLTVTDDLPCGPRIIGKKKAS